MQLPEVYTEEWIFTCRLGSLYYPAFALGYFVVVWSLQPVPLCKSVSDFVASSKPRVIPFFSSLVFFLETHTVVIGLMPS